MQKKLWAKTGSILLIFILLFSLCVPLQAFASSDGDRLRNKVVSVAKGEVGYRPSKKNVTKYGSWFGYQGAWCGFFALWCANEADQDIGTKMLGEIIPYEGSAHGQRASFMSKGQYKSRSSGYTPKKGDYIYFDWNHDGHSDHVGIVSGSSSSRVNTIEGNSSGAVRSKSYSRSDSDIMGYGTPDYEGYASGKGASALSGVEISSKTMTVRAGSSRKLSLTMYGKAKGEVQWTSSNSSVASVDANGNVTGKMGGTATVTAKAVSNGKTASCKVSVKQGASALSLNKNQVTLDNGSSVRLSASMKPSTTTDSVQWSSSNQDVVSVENGRVSARGVGTATVTARSDSGKTARCTVKVLPVPAEDLRLRSGSKILSIHGTTQITADFMPSYATDSVSFSSESKNISVTPQGLVTANAPGHAEIVATTSHGVTRSIELDVFSASEKIRLDQDKVTLASGSAQQLKAVLNPPDSTDAVHWTSSNTQVAAVDAAGLVTALEPGEAVITATTDSKESYTCTFTVVRPCESIQLSSADKTMEMFEKQTLSAVVSPSNTTDRLHFSSTDEKVLQVSDEGVVRAVSEGTATILCTAENGIVNQVTITVVRPEADVKAEKALTTTSFVSGTCFLGIAAYVPARKRRREEQKEFIQRHTR